MKSAKKIFVFFIAGLLLISGSGVFVMIHTCLGSKKAEVSFSAEHKCCGNKKKASKSCNIERKCCTVDFQYHKLNIVSLASEDKPSSDIIVKEVSVVDFKIAAIQNRFRFTDHLPPLIFQDFSVEFRQLLI